MYHIKADLREQKTAELLIEAARKQLRDPQGPTGNITALCRASGVSRSTFYRHFDDYDDVLRYIADLRFNDLLTKYEEHLKTCAEPVSPARWYAGWFQKYSREVVGLLRNGKAPLLIDSHIRGLAAHAEYLFPNMDPASDEFYYFAYSRSYAAIGTLQAWLKTGRKATVDELAFYMEQQMKFLN